MSKVVISHSVSSGNFVNVHQVNICADRRRIPKSAFLSHPTHTKPHLDIYTAPEVTVFYGRIDELNTLKTWLIQDRIRVITLLGLIGIGKTTLAIKLIEEISNQFQYIIYRSLRYCPTLDSFLTDLLQTLISTTLPHTLDRQVDLFLKFIRQHRCLIIIDDLQIILETEEFAGKYKSEFEGYHLLFKQIAELSHRSSLLLITSEQPEDVSATRYKFTRCLKLTGLGDCGKEILKDRELSEESMWDTLIEKYRGHPLWLEMTATMIQELFAGRVTDFLDYLSLILSNEICAELSRVWVRLTESEQEIVKYLAKQEEGITLSQVLQETSDNYSPEIRLNAIQSLKGRCFLEDAENGESSLLLRLDPIWVAYVRGCDGECK